MGTEIVFVLILPVVLICAPAAIWFWSGVAKAKPIEEIGYVRSYLPLIAGFAVSILALGIITYIEGNADFSSLIQQGYYTEAQRPAYLPGRLVGQAIVSLVFLLPAICLVVVPMTAKLIKADRLTLGGIVFRAAMGWVALSLIGWLFNLTVMVPPDSLPVVLGHTAVPVLVYGLPIPIAALLLLPTERKRT